VIPYDTIQRVTTSCARAWRAVGVRRYSHAELVQEGWRIALEALPRARRSTVPLEPYLRKAVTLSLGNAIAEWDALTTLPSSARSPSAAAPWRARAGVDAADKLPAACRPDFEVEDAQAAESLHNELMAVLLRLGAADQEILGHVLGGAEPAAAARAAGVKSERVYQARAAAVLAGRRAKPLRRAWEHAR
jgi:hypothetical protein